MADGCRWPRGFGLRAPVFGDLAPGVNYRPSCRNGPSPRLLVLRADGTGRSLGTLRALLRIAIGGYALLSICHLL